MKKELYPKSRYSNLKKKEQLISIIEEDKSLLSSFGVILDSVDPGIAGHLSQFIEETEEGVGHYPQWSQVSLDSTTWWWLRNLLIELQEYRTKTCQDMTGKREI